MVFIMISSKAITGIFWRQVKIRLMVEVDEYEDNGSCWKSQFEVGTDLIP